MDALMALRIKKMRKELGLTQEELGAKLGLQKSAIAKYENGRVENIKRSTILEMAKIFNCPPSYLMGIDEDEQYKQLVNDMTMLARIPFSFGYIPVYGSVSAGNGCVADGNVEDFLPVPEEMAKSGQYFGLRIKGDSMEPDIKENDIVIVKRQDDIPEDGQTVIAIVNGDEGLCKRLARYPEGICLVSNNPNYMPRYFSTADIESLPVRIVGVVERLIRDF